MGYYREWVGQHRKKFLGLVNKLMTGNITVAQAHAERDELVAIFNELADELEEINIERCRAQNELIVAHEQLRKKN